MSGAAGPRRLVRVAFWLSIVGHPFVVVPAMLLAVALDSLPLPRALEVVLMTVALTTGPVAWHIARQVGRRQYADFDVSVRAERGSFLPVALAVGVIGGGTLWLLDAPAFVLRGVLASVGMLVVAGALHRWAKVSLHALFASFCAVILYALSAALGLAAFALGVGWSRVVLARHTLVEVLVGTGVGIAGGWLVVWR